MISPRTAVGPFAAALVCLAGASPAFAQQPVSAPSDWVIDGTLRVRGESWSGLPFGPSGPGRPETEDVLLMRALADVSGPISGPLSARLQFSWHEQSGRRRGDRPTDAGSFDIHQAYVDWRISPGGSLRLGRQEMPLGSGRLFSLRNGPNIRLAFDAAQLDWRKDAWRVRSFVGRPVENGTDAFDDRPNDEIDVWGVYATRMNAAGGRDGVDLYYLGYERDNARFGRFRGRESRHSLGVRAFGDAGPYEWNVEAVVQGGRFAGGDIAAWTVASDLNRRVSSAPFGLLLGAKTNVTSGDEDPADPDLGTFNAMFPNLSYFSEAALMAPQNHIDFQPYVRAKLSPRLSLQLAADAFWRTQDADAIYRGPAIPVAVNDTSRFVGVQYDVDLRWRYDSSRSIGFSFVRWEPGDALKQARAEATDFVMLSLEGGF